MTSIDKYNENFEKVLIEGMSRLIDAIVECHNRTVEPVLVAISRRMPHVLFWFKNVLATDEQRNILDKVEVITELALPFLNHDSTEKQSELLIVDDVVSTGNTIDYVIQLVKNFSTQEKVRTYVFFASESNSALLSSEYSTLDDIGNDIGDDVELSIFHEIKSDAEKKALKDFITTIIAATLPIDVTYPLLYIEDSDKVGIDNLPQILKDPRTKGNDTYEIGIEYRTDLSSKNLYQPVKKGAINKSYTFLLPSEVASSLNNDFAKIRTYRLFGRTIIVPYAPNILSDDDLYNPDLFECKEYKEAWNEVLKHISVNKYVADGSEAGERISNRSCRSLACVANYLYSISTFNRIRNVNQASHTLKVSVNPKDLCLIVGKTVTTLIMPIIAAILENGLMSPRTHKKIYVSAIFIPNQYESDYIFSKYLSIDGDELKRDVFAIFDNAKKSKNEYPALFVSDLQYKVEGVMESFESLEKDLLIKDYEKKVALNRCVDELIDKGLLVSRYAYAQGDDNIRYWRRFFRMSTSL